jgi:hypothetical protein
VGIGLPTIVAGLFCSYSLQDFFPGASAKLTVPVYKDYIVQAARFQIVSGFGCVYTTKPDAVELMLVRSWSIILPLVSVMFYFRKLIPNFEG